MTGDTDWVIRQGFACVWVKAPSPEAAVEIAAKRLGHMGAWKVGPDVDQRLFASTSIAITRSRGTTRGRSDRRAAFALRSVLRKGEKEDVDSVGREGGCQCGALRYRLLRARWRSMPATA